MANTHPRGAPAFLASVKSASEACEAFAAGADVIDCKDPSAGALGRLELYEIVSVVDAVSAFAPVSATIGDTFATPKQAVISAEEVAATGVAIVKCGFFGSVSDIETVRALSSAKLGKAHLFAVLMADRVSDFSIVPHLAEAGFIGVMLDTADKQRGSLRQILDQPRIESFLADVRNYKLAAGLAGSLRDDDIGPLVALAPDILGFRGALCSEGRNGTIDEVRVVRVRKAIDAATKLQRSVA